MRIQSWRITLCLSCLALSLLPAACGGGGGSPGPPPPPQPSITSVSVSPSSANVQVQQTQQFMATVLGTGNFSTAVTWYVNDVQGGNATVGTINASGLYTAPASVPNPATVIVKAVSVQDTSKSGNANVTITPMPVMITVSPSSACRLSGGTQQFTATVTGTPDTRVTWSVNGIVGGNAQSGTISDSGFYSGPQLPTPSVLDVTVEATSVASPSTRATAQVQIRTNVPVGIEPAYFTLAVNRSVTFKTVLNCIADAQVVVHVSGIPNGNSTVGTIEFGEQRPHAFYPHVWEIATTYKAPAVVPPPHIYTSGTVRLSLSAEAVGLPPGGFLPAWLLLLPKVYLAVAPGNPTVRLGTTQQFRAFVRGSDSNRTVEWFVSDIPGGNSGVGTISAAGVYTAPPSLPNPATVTVKAVSSTDPSQSATANVTIVVADPPTPQLEWLRTIDFGNTLPDIAFGVSTDADNNVVAGGWQTRPVAGGTGSSPTGVMIGLDAAGNQRWAQELASSNSFVTGIAASANLSEFYFTGGSSSKAFCGQISSGGTMLTDPLSKTFETESRQGLEIQRVGDSLYVNTGLHVTQLDLACNVRSGFRVRDRGNVNAMWATQNYILASGAFSDSEGWWAVAGFVRKMDPAGQLIWEKIYDDTLPAGVFEDDRGYIFMAATEFVDLSRAPDQQLLVVKMDPNGNEMWRSRWDGDNPGPSDEIIFSFFFPSGGRAQGNWVQTLIPRPGGGVVVISTLGEFFVPSSSWCGIDWPNCWDFGAWALDENGNTVWKLRYDHRGSPSDDPRAATWDASGKLILVGRTSSPSRRDELDAVVGKFRVP